MPLCQAVNEANDKCRQQTNNYFWFRDSQDLLDQTFNLCQRHSDQLLGKLLRKEYEIKQKLEKLKRDIKNMRSRTKGSKYQKDYDDLKELYRKQSFFYEQLNIARNRTCALCQFPLKEPQDEKYQLDDKYSIADFKTERGYRRADCLFHTMCGRIWIKGVIYLENKNAKWIQTIPRGQELLLNV